MEDNLHIHKLTAAHVNVHICTQEFLRQYRNIETVGIETRKVTAFNIIGNTACHFLKGRTIRHIFIINAMNGRSFCRNMHFGIDAHGLGFLIPVGIYLEITDFDYSVGVDICSRSLQIKKDNRIFQI